MRLEKITQPGALCCLLHTNLTNYLNNQIMEGVMGKACSAHVREGN
jgi:hypothetical protein